MKNLIFVLLLLVSTNAFCKKKPKPVEHIGHMTYHAPKFRNLIEGRDDLYEVDDYVCLPGDEHHAPTCATRIDWYVTTAFGYVEIELADGSTVFVTSHQEHLEFEPWKHDGDTITLRNPGNEGRQPLFEMASEWELLLADGETQTFRYEVDHLGNVYRLDFVDLATRQTQKNLLLFPSQPK